MTHSNDFENLEKSAIRLAVPLALIAYLASFVYAILTSSIILIVALLIGMTISTLLIFYGIKKIKH